MGSVTKNFKIYRRQPMKNIKLYESFQQDLSYTDFWGKQVSHEDALKSSIESKITEILREEGRISEKDFSNYDKVIEEAKEIVDRPEVFEKIQKLHSEGKRASYISEIIYDEMKQSK